MIQFLLGLLLASLLLPARAQTLYKCETGAKISYGSAPCADGASTVLAAPPAPPPTPLDPALKAEADRLTRERHAREAREDRQAARASRSAATHRRHCASLRLHKQWADDDLARATTAARARALRKAHHAAEQLAMACPD